MNEAGHILMSISKKQNDYLLISSRVATIIMPGDFP